MDIFGFFPKFGPLFKKKCGDDDITYLLCKVSTSLYSSVGHDFSKVITHLYY